MTMETMRQKKRMWALLHPLPKPLVNYRHQNTAGIGNCAFPLLHWQSWKKSSTSMLPSIPERLMQVTCDSVSRSDRDLSKTLSRCKSIQGTSHCFFIFQGTETCPWPFSSLKFLLKSKLTVPALLRWQYFEKAAKAHFYLSNATVQ